VLKVIPITQEGCAIHLYFLVCRSAYTAALQWFYILREITEAISAEREIVNGLLKIVHRPEA